MIDFTPCKVNPFKAYGGGNGNKIAVLYNGEDYMLKFPPKKTNTKIVYSNASISEYLACHIYSSAGFDTQDTLYGTYTVNHKMKEVVACKDFTTDGYTLMEFAKLKNACLDKSNEDSNGYQTELHMILDAIDTQKLVDGSQTKERFWDMFVMDAFLGNFDRHNGNWGFLVNAAEQKARLAPVYDCGSCLYPQITEADMKQVLQDASEQDKRVFVFPTSAIKVDDKKINYFDFLSQNSNQECTNALVRVAQKISMEHVLNIVQNADFLSNTQKDFYSLMLNKRKEKILDFSLVKIQHFEKQCTAITNLEELSKIGQQQFGWDAAFAKNVYRKLYQR